MENTDVYELFGTSDMPHMRKLIIHVALTGNYSMKSANPHVPYGPEEIADDARKCFNAGASSFHIHARESDGKPSCRRELFEEIVAKVRAGCPGAIICVTTSGRVFKTFEQRSAVLDITGDSKPDFASLSLGSMNFPKEPSINSPEMIESLARKMMEKGVRPELEAFETGMVNHAAYLLRKGILGGPLLSTFSSACQAQCPGGWWTWSTRCQASPGVQHGAQQAAAASSCL